MPVQPPPFTKKGKEPIASPVTEKKKAAPPPIPKHILEKFAVKKDALPKPEAPITPENKQELDSYYFEARNIADSNLPTAEKQQKVMDIQKKLIDDRERLVSLGSLYYNSKFYEVSNILMQLGRQMMDDMSNLRIQQVGSEQFVKEMAPSDATEEQVEIAANIFTEKEEREAFTMEGLSDEYKRSEEAVKLFTKYRENIYKIMNKYGIDVHAASFGKDSFFGRLGDKIFIYQIGMRKLFREGIKNGLDEEDLAALKTLTLPEEITKEGEARLKTPKIMAEVEAVEGGKAVTKKVEMEVESLAFTDPKKYKGFPLLSEDSFEKLSELKERKLTRKEANRIFNDVVRAVSGLDKRLEVLQNQEAAAAKRLMEFIRE